MTNDHPGERAEFTGLEPQYRKVQKAGTIITHSVLMALALLLLLIEALWPVVLAECLIAVSFIFNLSIISAAFRFKGYIVGERDITYRSGILFPKVTTIPFARIQQVSVKQNPVSKHFGLYSLEVVNGAQALDSMSIPGLSESTATHIKDNITTHLRNELI